MTHPASRKLDDEDFYFEGPFCVFTEGYHLRRGYCCESDCRHCPYRDEDGNILPEARQQP